MATFDSAAFCCETAEVFVVELTSVDACDFDLLLPELSDAVAECASFVDETFASAVTVDGNLTACPDCAVVPRAASLSKLNALCSPALESAAAPILF